MPKTPIAGQVCSQMSAAIVEGMGKFGPTGMNTAFAGTGLSHEIRSNGTVNTAKSVMERTPFMVRT
jgi:hypothetical protein